MESGNIPEDLKKLDEKIRRMNGEKAKSGHGGSAGRPAASRIGAAIAADLIAGVLVGMGIGYVLDMLAGTKPVLLSVFVLLGGAAGFLNMYRTVKDEEKRNG